MVTSNFLSTSAVFDADPIKTSTKIILMNISLNIKSNKLGHLIGEVNIALNVVYNIDF